MNMKHARLGAQRPPTTVRKTTQWQQHPEPCDTEKYPRYFVLSGRPPHETAQLIAPQLNGSIVFSGFARGQSCYTAGAYVA